MIIAHSLTQIATVTMAMEVTVPEMMTTATMAQDPEQNLQSTMPKGSENFLKLSRYNLNFL